MAAPSAHLRREGRLPATAPVIFSFPVLVINLLVLPVFVHLCFGLMWTLPLMDASHCGPGPGLLGHCRFPGAWHTQQLLSG